MNGVDVSYHNGAVDWHKVKAAGMEFAICRSSYGKSNIDESFLRNVEGAHSVGMICGAYHYSYALNEDDAKREAEFCKKVISDAGVLLELPVWFDMEDADGYKKRHNFNFTKKNVTAICKTFLENIKPLNCGVYASYSWLEDLIDWRALGCSVWNAQWGKRDFLQGFMWQYTDSLNIGGKLFDANRLYN